MLQLHEILLLFFFTKAGCLSIKFFLGCFGLSLHSGLDFGQIRMLLDKHLIVYFADIGSRRCRGYLSRLRNSQSGNSEQERRRDGESNDFYIFLVVFEHLQKTPLKIISGRRLTLLIISGRRPMHNIAWRKVTGYKCPTRRNHCNSLDNTNSALRKSCNL